MLEFRDKGLSNVEYFASTPEALAEKLDAYVEKWKAGQLEPDEKQCERAKELYDCGRQVQKYRKLYQNMTGK